jgi:hypothetical protein
VNINDELKEQLKHSNEIITITTAGYSNSDEMTSFEDLIYKPLEGNFVFNGEKSSNDSQNPYNSYYLNGMVSDNFIALFRIGKIYSEYKILTAPNSDISTFGFSFKDTNKKELLGKYNLKNDFDIYKYLVGHYDDKINAFSNADKIKLNYLIKTYVNVAIPVSKISLIEGDLNGYMYTINNGLIYEVHVIHNGTNYAFGFFNEKSNKYFNLNNVKDFLRNVYFKD